MRTIITRELMNNLFNLRFIVGILLCVIITVTCVVVLTHQYRQEMDDYSLRISLQDDFLNNYAHTNRMGGMITPQKPPEKFHPLITGIPRDAELGSFDDNPLSVLFPHIDFLFIMTIIMSLLALLFSYDSVTGEREQGTLKLLLSNSFSRANMILGKWIGGVLSLLIPFILSLLIGVLYVNIHPHIQWDHSNWLAFVLLILASVTFISLFFVLGLFVSTMSRFSSVSILSALFLWVLFILVIPNISPYIAAQLYQIPSVTRVEREYERLTSIERDNLGRKLSAEVTRKYEEEYGQRFTELRNLRGDEIRQRAADDLDFKALYEAYREETGQAWNEANRIQREKASKIRDELAVKSKRQTAIAKNLACISPYANFVYVATDLTGTGIRSQEYFSSVAAGKYMNEFNEYEAEKVREAREIDPTFDSNTFLDISDRPRFSFTEEPLNDRLQAVLPYWGVLLLFNALFFAAAFVGFIRYDVR